MIDGRRMQGKNRIESTYEFCKCKEPLQFHISDDHCAKCTYKISFKKRAKKLYKGSNYFDYINMPNNLITDEASRRNERIGKKKKICISE